MRRLLYIGSPRFDGIGLLNTEAQKMQKYGDLTILDGIAPGAYPEIKNFSRADNFVWTWIRKAQFLGTLDAEALRYVHVVDLISSAPPGDHDVVRDVLNEAILDHCVCNNITGAGVEAYRDRHWARHYAFLCSAYEALQGFVRQEAFAQIVVFNGRNTLAKLLIAVARSQSIQVCWLEYFGKRDEKMTYIASPVDIFDFDAMSEYILDAYHASADPEKERSAQECLTDRIARGDPMLAKWGVDFSVVATGEGPQDKKVVAFFFSSEDEYPAVKPSVHGFNPPSEQYHAFSRICERIVELGLQQNYRILIKLHPRYAVEKAKLDHAQGQWDLALAAARHLGLDFELVPPLTSAYKVIRDADLVFSYGSTAWEATYLGKPAVLMGPNLFASHDCAHIANSVGDVIGFLRNIPDPKPVANCYPYAWAWRELGVHAQTYQARLPTRMPRRVANVLLNRFSLLDHAE